MLQGSCHCAAVHGCFEALPECATARHGTVGRRSAALWACDFQDERRRASGPASVYVCGDSLGSRFCAACGCALDWRALEAGSDGRRRTAVNLRPAAPQTEGGIAVHRADGLELPRRLPQEGGGACGTMGFSMSGPVGS